MTASPAGLAEVHSIRITPSGKAGYTTSLALIYAILFAAKNNYKICNVSYNFAALANPSENDMLHRVMQYYHDQKGGLIFFAAGNGDENGQRSYQAPGQFLPYVIPVSSIGQDGKLSFFSTYGNFVWFSAPGQNIYCSTNKGTLARNYKGELGNDGSSFAAPLVAGVAALIWGANPRLKNTDIERILVSTAVNPEAAHKRTAKYGYGVPDAEAAMKMLYGRR